MAKEKEEVKPISKYREGIPMTEEQLKEQDQVWTDIEESIALCKDCE